MKKIFQIVVAILISLLIFSFGIGSMKPMPDNAIIIVDEKSKTYYAPPFFEDNSINIPSDFKYVRAENIRGKQYAPDTKCRDQGYFIQDTGSLFWSMLEKVRLIKQKNRWNEDGSWNW